LRIRLSAAFNCVLDQGEAVCSSRPGVRLLTGLTRRTVGLVAAAVVGVLVLPLKGRAHFAAIAAVLVLALRLTGVGA
jgi:hypothetical protein